ncbi:hypothetical protein UlMin_031023 [Ulmus minor]
MEKKQSSHGSNQATSSRQKKKVFGTSDLQLNENDSSRLVGGIVEKGFSDQSSSKPFFSSPPLPKPTVLPFPVARHRSHGPHWAPLGSKMGAGDEEEDGNPSDEEDKAFMNFDPIAPHANPVKRKKKKDMDFSRWRELLPSEKPVMADKSRVNVSRLRKVEKQEREAIETGDASSVVDMELDLQETGKDSFSNSKIDAEEKGHDSKALIGALRSRDRSSLASTMVSSGSNFEYEQDPTSLESQIDAENRALLKTMSPVEIAEAQAEIMAKINPDLLKKLKRGETKKKKTTSNETPSGEDNAKRRSGEDKAETLSGEDNAETRPNPAKSSLWDAWSERVESIRKLRFLLDGTVIEDDIANGAETGRFNERDFLRTEGDPGAAGYTIKEAVELTRSVIPGQRAIALHMLLAILDNALHNICQGQVGCSLRSNDKVYRFTDWEAIWAYALGPEPELILSLRLCLDDNHSSVVLACAKVIQCMLSCDLNENYFDLSEKLADVDNICTAPVFRSKPEIDVGFLRGAFWKYNAKPSNIAPRNEDVIDDESEEKPTIQDDIVLAGQDFAAGLVRMGALPRLRYILESDHNTALGECVLSILVAIARHSPTCANAIMECQKLIEIVAHRFTSKDNIEIQPFKIKTVILLKVLARSHEKNCVEFIKKGVFQAITWHLYQYVPSIDHWVKSGLENCKLSSALMVEQLRFWKVCIQHGHCVSNFSDIFSSLCLWLNPPTLEKLIESNILVDYASISAEAYLVLEALARRLPNFFAQKYLNNKILEHAGDSMESWSWSHVGPMVDLAVKWIVLLSEPYVRNFWRREIGISDVLQDSSATSLLWVYSSVMSMLAKVLERMMPDDSISQMGNDELVPWLPEFVPKAGLEIIKNVCLSFSNANGTTYGTPRGEDRSFIEVLGHLRQHNDIEKSLASVCCLHGLVQTIATIDKLIQLAKKRVHNISQENSLSREELILKDGILNGSMAQLRSVQNIFVKLVASEWQFVQSIETFGRGGTAPGVGVGWGASGGGYWSSTVLLAQADARLVVDLLETFQIASMTDIPTEEAKIHTAQIINSCIAASLIAGPRDITTVEKAFKILVHVSVLKYLDLCIRGFCLNRKVKLFGWEYKEEDYLHFSKVLDSHFRNRWLLAKKKVKSIEGLKSSPNKTFKKGTEAMSSVLPSDVPSPVQSVPLVWKLHSLSVILLVGMGVIEEDKSRDVYEALQDLYGDALDTERSRSAETTWEKNANLTSEPKNKKNMEFLRFQSEIHDSYSTFIETLVDQFSAISYGDLIYGRQVAVYLHCCVEAPVRLAAWKALTNARVLELLPPLETCLGEAEGYLQPIEDNDDILEAYVKSWTSGTLDRAANRGSVAYTMALHHLSSFIFHPCDGDKLLLRNRLVKSLLQDLSLKQHHEVLMLNLIQYNGQFASHIAQQKDATSSDINIEKRLEILVEACRRTSSLLNVVKKLESLLQKSSS